MITAVVSTEGDVEALAATLGGLVPGVAQGLVADAVVVGRGPRPEEEAVADALGATFLVAAGDPWFAAAALARQDWLLCLRAGDVPLEGWIEPAGRLISASRGARLASLAWRPAWVNARLAAAVEAALGASRARAGHLVHRSILADGRLSRRTRPVRLAAAIEPRRG